MSGNLERRDRRVQLASLRGLQAQYASSLGWPA